MAAAVVFVPAQLSDRWGGGHSVLEAHGASSQAIADLAWVMFAGAAAISLLVLVLLGYALFSSPQGRRRIRSHPFILAGGVAFPVATLTALLVYGFDISADVDRGSAEDRLFVEVVGHQWWWEFKYIGAAPHLHFRTANELHIPVGRPVELRLRSADVIHTIWIPSLSGKRDLIPGTTNTLVLQADSPGIYRGQCNEFCGAQHTKMGLRVFADPPDVFDAWWREQLEPARPVPDGTWAAAGRQQFQLRCAICHTVRGTPAGGVVGPDLTHLMSRSSIAAATLPNTIGHLSGWVANPQSVKPENFMPNLELSGPQLTAIRAYLLTLE